MARNTYSQERLVWLLRLLQPAPESWVARAQRTILDLIATDRGLAEERTVAETELAELRRALEHDPLFRQSFDTDPVAAAVAAGWPELALELEQEMHALVALAEQIAADAAYRAELAADPVRTLAASGVPADAAEPFLRALAASDDALAKLPEVVAHRHEQEPIQARLVILLLASSGVTETLRDFARSA